MISGNTRAAEGGGVTVWGGGAIVCGGCGIAATLCGGGAGAGGGVSVSGRGGGSGRLRDDGRGSYRRRRSGRPHRGRRQIRSRMADLELIGRPQPVGGDDRRSRHMIGVGVAVERLAALDDDLPRRRRRRHRRDDRLYSALLEHRRGRRLLGASAHQPRQNRDKPGAGDPAPADFFDPHLPPFARPPTRKA